MLIKLLYIQSTPLSPLQENFHERNRWDFIDCPPHRLSPPQEQKWVSRAGDPSEEKLLYTAEAPGIPSCTCLEATGAVHVAGEIQSKSISGNWGWRKEQSKILCISPHPPNPFLKFLFPLLFLLRWFCHFEKYPLHEELLLCNNLKM